MFKYSKLGYNKAVLIVKFLPRFGVYATLGRGTCLNVDTSISVFVRMCLEDLRRLGIGMVSGV